MLLRMNRSIQVEGVFGVLKENYGFRRFLMRGQKNVETRFFLLVFALNIEKLCNRAKKKKNWLRFVPIERLLIQFFAELYYSQKR